MNSSLRYESNVAAKIGNITCTVRSGGFGPVCKGTVVGSRGSTLCIPKCPFRSLPPALAKAWVGGHTVLTLRPPPPACACCYLLWENPHPRVSRHCDPAQGWGQVPPGLYGGLAEYRRPSGFFSGWFSLLFTWGSVNAPTAGTRPAGTRHLERGRHRQHRLWV